MSTTILTTNTAPIPSACTVRRRGRTGALPTDVYAIKTFADGTFDLEVMTRDEVEAVRANIRKPSPAWGSAWGEMAKKTAVHRLCKRLDLTPAARAAVDHIEGDYEALAAPETPQIAPPRPSGDDGLDMYDDLDPIEEMVGRVPEAEQEETGIE